MSFESLASELAGNLPGLSSFLAEDYIKRAWRKVRDARIWSFLVTDDSIVLPTQITAGSFNVTQYDNIVTADAVASAAILAIQSVEIPLTFLQLRFQNPSQTSEIYNIVSVDTSVPTALVFTLDRVVVEATNATSPYICYRAYVLAPVSDFLKWLSVVDMTNGIPVNLDYTSKDFDKKDPQRQALGLSYFVGYYKASDDIPSLPIYEFWPGCTQGQSFYVRYRRRGPEFSAPTDVQPDMIPDDLIIQAALGFYAYPFAMANVGHFPAMAKVNWAYLIGDAKKTYFSILQDAKRQDDNQAMQSVISRGHGLRGNASGYPWPIDANFLQSHLVTFPS